MSESAVVLVSAQIVQLVDVEAVAFVSNDFVHPGAVLFVLLDHFAFDEPADELCVQIIFFRVK
jgi:phosphoribosylaminoimidazole (AIR) synthetase